MCSLVAYDTGDNRTGGVGLVVNLKHRRYRYHYAALCEVPRCPPFVIFCR